MEPLSFRLFGRTAIRIGVRELRVTPSAAAVLARLLLSGGRLVTVDELCRAMRPECVGPTDRDARVAVQKRVCELRKVLDQHRPGVGSAMLRTDRGAVTAYRLLAERGQVDIFRFEDLAERASSAAGADRADLLRQALAL